MVIFRHHDAHQKAVRKAHALAEQTLAERMADAQWNVDEHTGPPGVVAPPAELELPSQRAARAKLVRARHAEENRVYCEKFERARRAPSQGSAIQAAQPEVHFGIEFGTEPPTVIAVALQPSGSVQVLQTPIDAPMDAPCGPGATTPEPEEPEPEEPEPEEVRLHVPLVPHKSRRRS